MLESLFNKVAGLQDTYSEEHLPTTLLSFLRSDPEIIHFQKWILYLFFNTSKLFPRIIADRFLSIWFLRRNLRRSACTI